MDQFSELPKSQEAIKPGSKFQLFNPKTEVKNPMYNLGRPIFKLDLTTDMRISLPFIAMAHPQVTGGKRWGETKLKRYECITPFSPGLGYQIT